MCGPLDNSTSDIYSEHSAKHMIETHPTFLVNKSSQSGIFCQNVSTGRSPYFFFRVPFHGTVILPGVFAFICIFVSACLLVFAGPLGHVISSSGKYWDRVSPFSTRLRVYPGGDSEIP